jgi:hypothetical protein
MMARSEIRHSTLMVSGDLPFELCEDNEMTWQAEETFQACSTWRNYGKISNDNSYDQRQSA